MAWRKRFGAFLALVAAAFASLALAPAARAAHETLTIGVQQFPPNFNPLINATAAEAYIRGMVLRPFTQYDKDWKLICMLCTELPTLENGKAIYFYLVVAFSAGFSERWAKVMMSSAEQKIAPGLHTSAAPDADPAPAARTGAADAE